VVFRGEGGRVGVAWGKWWCKGVGEVLQVKLLKEDNITLMMNTSVTITICLSYMFECTF
jgi:hypothetical protein